MRFRHEAQPEDLEGLSPIKYHIPMEWGSIQVTESADEAYGFKPKIAEYAKGPISQEEAKKAIIAPWVDVYIAGPEEKPSDMPPDTLGWSRSAIEKDRLVVQMGFGSTAAEYAEMSAENIRAIAKIEGMDEDEIAQFYDEHEPPLAERAEQEVPRDLVHVGTLMLLSRVSERYAAALRSKENKGHLRRWTWTGGVAIGLSNAAIITANSLSEDPFIRGNTGTFAVTTLSGVMIVTLAEARRLIRSLPDQQRLSQMAGKGIATEVADDFHTAYCIDHFNWQAEQMLNGVGE